MITNGEKLWQIRYDDIFTGDLCQVDVYAESAEDAENKWKNDPYMKYCLGEFRLLRIKQIAGPGTEGE
jgi:hypothetical protein